MKYGGFLLGILGKAIIAETIVKQAALFARLDWPLGGNPTIVPKKSDLPRRT
jgi:hypothetical protein